MCQLVYSNLRLKIPNICTAYGLGFVDGLTNTDGTGFYSPNPENFVWKTKYGGAQLVNLLPSLVEDVKTASPIILHTRFATIGVGSTKTITDENAHPFKSGRYILAHNGTLTPKTTPNPKPPAEMTDSEYFLQVLSSRPENEPFVDAFNATMEQFQGKFAFLIHDLTTKRMYAIRGSSANLNWMPVKVNGETRGFIINTQRKEILPGMVLAANIAKLYKTEIDFDMTTAVEFPINTIWDITDKTPVEVGKTKENFPMAARGGHLVGSGTHTPAAGKTTSTKEDSNRSSIPGVSFLKFTQKLNMPFTQVNFLVKQIFGVGFLSLDNNTLAALDKVFEKEVNKRISKKTIETWEEILNFCTSDEASEAYGWGIVFPYFIDNITHLNQLSDKLRKAYKEHASKYSAARAVFYPTK